MNDMGEASSKEEVPKGARRGNDGNVLSVPLYRESPSSCAEDVLSNLQLTIAMQAGTRLRPENDLEYRFCQGCNVDYYEQNTGFTCSYASAQMITSALLSIESKVYRESLFDGSAFVPNVRSIQVLIERAWRQGFDVEGSHHFSQSLVGKQMRIGASDIAALFRANRVPTRIFDFDYGSDSWRTVEHFCSEYFFTDTMTVSDDDSTLLKFPLILGYAEHTIVVVGCDRDLKSNDVNLIVFDPALGVRRTKDAAKGNVRFFYAKRDFFSRQKQFQILAFGPTKDHQGYLIESDSDVSVAGNVLFAIRPPRVTRS